MEEPIKFRHDEYEIENSDDLTIIATSKLLGQELIMRLYNNDMYLESDTCYIVPNKDDDGVVRLYKIPKDNIKEDL